VAGTFDLDEAATGADVGKELWTRTCRLSCGIPVTDKSPIDTYLATLPQPQADALGHLRNVVARLVPEAEQKISYGMPAFYVGKHLLISYAGWKRHCSIYPLTDSFLERHANALDTFEQTKGSVHFTPERPLPDALVEELVRARLDDLESGRR
jgi:uncharacterized protein YdhG (YjbR/CyaY superfamily)